MLVTGRSNAWRRSSGRRPWRRGSPGRRPPGRAAHARSNGRSADGSSCSARRSRIPMLPDPWPSSASMRAGTPTPSTISTRRGVTRLYAMTLVDRHLVLAQRGTGHDAAGIPAALHRPVRRRGHHDRGPVGEGPRRADVGARLRPEVHKGLVNHVPDGVVILATPTARVLLLVDAARERRIERQPGTDPGRRSGCRAPSTSSAGRTCSTAGGAHPLTDRPRSRRRGDRGRRRMATARSGDRCAARPERARGRRARTSGRIAAGHGELRRRPTAHTRQRAGVESP